MDELKCTGWPYTHPAFVLSLTLLACLVKQFIPSLVLLFRHHASAAGRYNKHSHVVAWGCQHRQDPTHIKLAGLCGPITPSVSCKAAFLAPQAAPSDLALSLYRCSLSPINSIINFIASSRVLLYNLLLKSSSINKQLTTTAIFPCKCLPPSNLRRRLYFDNSRLHGSRLRDSDSSSRR